MIFPFNLALNYFKFESLINTLYNVEWYLVCCIVEFKVIFSVFLKIEIYARLNLFAFEIGGGGLLPFQL